MKILIMDRVSSLDKENIINSLGYGDWVAKFERAKNLSKLGLEVHVMDNTDSEFGEIVFHQLKTKKGGKLGMLLFQLDYLIKLIRIPNKYHFDIIYTRIGTTGLIGILIKMIYRSKLVFELNGLYSEDWKFEKELKGKIGFFRTLKLALANYIELFVARRADAILPVTDKIKNILIEKGIDQNKISTIPNGANTDLFKPIGDTAVLDELRDRLNISKDDYVITFVGNIQPWHGLEYLIRSAPLILKIYPHTRFLIVGEGDIKSNLMNLAEKLGVIDKFIFTGKIPYQTVPLYISLSDVCVAPFTSARNEETGQGLAALKIYEYLACEKPVVASNISGIGDLLRDSNSGLPFTPDNPDELSKAIIKLLGDEQLRDKMGKNGRKLMVNNYSWEHTARKMIEVFRNLLVN